MSDILGIVILGSVSLEVATELTQALFQELGPSSQSLPATAVVGGETRQMFQPLGLPLPVAGKLLE